MDDGRSDDVKRGTSDFRQDGERGTSKCQSNTSEPVERVKPFGELRRIDSDDEGSILSRSDDEGEDGDGERSHRLTRGLSDLDSDFDDFGEETDLECDDQR